MSAQLGLPGCPIGSAAFAPVYSSESSQLRKVVTLFRLS